jgi:hypothetical protein
MKTPHMRKLGKQLSRNTGEVLIGTEGLLPAIRGRVAFGFFTAKRKRRETDGR